MDITISDVRIFAKSNRKVCIAVNVLNEKTFASTSTLLQPSKSVSVNLKRRLQSLEKSSLTCFEASPDERHKS